MLKKILAFIFVFPFMLGVCSAAIPSGTVGEVRTTGSDTNGGGFVAGITAISSKTDLVVSAGSNLNVSSASYGFTSADVGRWLTVTAGSSWITGSYQILSVTGGVATLNRSPAPINTTNGSFTIYFGLDYSQKNANNTSGSNISTTDLVTNGTTTVISATAAFTPDIVGNIIYVTGGSGVITAAWYEVVSYTNATTVVLERATGLTTGVGATMNIGGAFATPQAAYNALGAVKYYVKNTATYTVTSGISVQGTWIGYTTTRGDNGRPTIQGSTTSNMTLFALAGGSFSLSNFIFDCNSLTNCQGVDFHVGFWGNATNFKVMNYTGTNGVVGGSTEITNCEVTAGTGTGIAINEGVGIVDGCYVHDTATNGIAAVGAIAFNNIVTNITGTGHYGISATNGTIMSLTNNTVYNTAGDCIVLANEPQQLNMTIAVNNVLVSCGGYGINSTSGSYYASSFLDGNAFYACVSGNRHQLDDTVWSSSDSHGAAPYTNVHDIILTTSPFVNAGAGNFALNSVSGGGAAILGLGVPQTWSGLGGTTSYPSMGAPQPNVVTITGGSFSFGQ